MPTATDSTAPVFRQRGLLPEQLKDQDEDGISDVDDNCPSTPRQLLVFHTVYDTPVDRCGCPLNPCSVYDSDHDGVFDCYDKCPHTRKGVKVATDGCPIPSREPIRFKLDVKFEFAKANILDAYVPDLEKIKRIMVANPEITLMLEGHTDSVGTPDYNKALSRVRAQICRRYILADRRIKPERITALGYGEEMPVASNATDLGRALNRRTVAAINLVNEIVPPNSLDDLLRDQELATAEAEAERAEAARRKAATEALATPIPEKHSVAEPAEPAPPPN